MKEKNVAVLIPSLDPEERTVQYVDELIAFGFPRIIVVDDGSKAENRHYFEELTLRPACTVLRHEKNRGKGAALKTGFRYFIDNFSPEEWAGIVTADADGQHSARDTRKAAEDLLPHPEALILGTRDFSGKNVPFKSRIGNRITSCVFALLNFKVIHDTQTGLRGIPFRFLEDCTRLEGERFEYEINMLIWAAKNGISILEEPIETIYYESNRATHFSAVKDSVKIYQVMFRSFVQFSASGIFSAAVDLSVFTLITKVFLSGTLTAGGIFAGTAAARLLSALVNFFLNKKVVFRCGGRVISDLVRYGSLCVAQMLTSWLLVTGIYFLSHWDASWVKMFVDLALFFVSYQIQRRWVFRGEKR